MKTVNIVKLHAAAFLFSQGTTTAKGVAEALQTSEAVIYRWRKLTAWDAALDALKFTGDRVLHREWRDVQRESSDLVEQARQIYQQLLTNGTPKHK